MGARDFVGKPLDFPKGLIRVHNLIEIRLFRMQMERLLARLARLVPTDTYRQTIAGALAVAVRREAIVERGRMLGDLLLALDETRGVR